MLITLRGQEGGGEDLSVGEGGWGGGADLWGGASSCVPAFNCCPS